VFISLAFGLAAQLMLARVTTRWIGIVGGIAWFVGGLLASEVLFGTRSGAEIAVVDGLAFHQSLIGGFVLGMGAIVIAWVATDRPHHLHGPTPR
jgi:hypothetical protein